MCMFLLKKANLKMVIKLKIETLWNQNLTQEKEKNSIIPKKTDILIIGGGITGLTTAYFLMGQKQDITLIDQGEIGHTGITTKSTAKINFLQGICYQTIEKNFSEKASQLYFKSQVEAMNIIKNIVAKHQVDCDLEAVDAFIFTNDEKNIGKLKKEKDLLSSWDIKCKEIQRLPIPIPMKYGVGVNNTYVFQPVKYVQALRKIVEKNIKIKEHCMATQISGNGPFYVKTTDQIIEANTVVIACHFPFFLKPAFIPIKSYIKREYVNTAKYENCPSNFTAINIDQDLHSIRFYHQYVIYGSNQHRSTDQISFHDNFQKSQTDFEHLWGKAPEYTWINQDVMTNDGLPFIGEVKPGIFIATGYQAWGITNGTIAGKIISDLISNQETPYTQLFNPNRFVAAGIKESLTTGLHYLKAYWQTKVLASPYFYPENVYVVPVKGKKYGVYVDENRVKHIVDIVCPHMKCNLAFNEKEKTWDCPCHGSRFDIDGNLIEGPSKEDVSIKNKSKLKINDNESN